MNDSPLQSEDLVAGRNGAIAGLKMLKFLMRDEVKRAHSEIGMVCYAVFQILGKEIIKQPFRIRGQQHKHKGLGLTGFN